MVSTRQLGEGIFEIALNRPGKKNALSIELRDALAGIFAAQFDAFKSHLFPDDDR